MIFRCIALAATAVTLGALAAMPASAQRNDNVLIIYGNDPCPTSGGEEIVVCARLPEGERYRIPEALRETRELPADLSWRQRAEALEYVGATGTMSCSPVGAGGFTGCTQELLRAARAERGGGALLEF